MATKTEKQSMPRLKQLYVSSLRNELKEELKLDNINQVPVLEKIIVNTGLGKAKDDKKVMEVATTTLTKITGQKPLQTTARQSIASFKLREGNKIGLKVTLRGDQMYEFVDRLVNIVLPRLRDFHGVSTTAFDQQGNYALGLNDQTVFPEITFEDASITHGLQVIFVMKTEDTAHSKLLLTKLGVPFEKEDKESK